MAFTLADAVIYFKGDTSDLEKSTEGAKATTESFVSKASGLLGGALVTGFAAAGAAAVGLGAAALNIQGDFDNALDAITVKTGATGAELDAMGESVRNLKTSSAGLGVDWETIGNTLGTVATRTGATGETLETLTGQILNFSRLTGGDAVANTEKLSRTMGDWGVQTEDAGALLDKLYGAQQTFGIGFDDLSTKLVQFGAPLRQMGFSIDESIAMFGKWEQEGVNTELVIGSLRIAAGKFADANIPLREGLNQTMEAIKGAGSESEALSLAMETFGARAGPDMAAAIREGRFELDEAVASLASTKGSLGEAAEGTLDFRDRWSMTMAKVTDAMLPLGEKLAELAEKLFPAISDAIDFLMPYVTELIDWLIQLIDSFSGTQTEGEEMTGFFSGIPAILETVTGAFQSVVGFLQDHFFGTMDETGGKFDFIKERVDEIMPYIQTIIENVLGAIQDFWTAHGDTIMEVVGNTFETISTVISTTLDLILQAIKLALQIITGDWEGAGDTLKEMVETLWNGIKDIFNNSLDNIKALIGDVDLAAAGRAIVDSLRNGITEKWDDLVSWFRDQLAGLTDMLPFSEPKDPNSPLRGLSKAGESMVKQIRDGMEQAALTVSPLGRFALAGLANNQTSDNRSYYYFDQMIGPNGDVGGVRDAARRGVLDARRARGL